jgi:hypothetical protein
MRSRPVGDLSRSQCVWLANETAGGKGLACTGHISCHYDREGSHLSRRQRAEGAVKDLTSGNGDGA